MPRAQNELSNEDIKMRNIGYKTELFAMFWLMLRGYKPICRNFTVRGGEIDLIMKKGEFLVFVEVKARRKDSIVSALEAVTRDKEKHLRFAAMRYMQTCKKKYRALQPRFDVVCVSIGKVGFSVTEHIKNAF